MLVVTNYILGAIKLYYTNLVGKMIITRIFVIVSFLVTTLCAGEGSVITTEAVVVSATKTEAEIREVVEKVDVIARSDIENSGASTTEELIQSIPGVAISNNPQAQIRINGMAGAYTKVLIDGVPVHGKVGGAFPIENIPLGDIERIEVVKGAAGALYGSDAIGGVINFITRKRSRATEITGGYRYQSNVVSSTFEEPGYEDSTFEVSTADRQRWGGAHSADMGVRHTFGVVDFNASAGLYVDGGVVDTVEKEPVPLFGDRPYWTMNELKRYNGAVYAGVDLSEDLSLSVQGRYSYDEDSRSITQDLKQSFVDHNIIGVIRGDYFISENASLGGYASFQRLDHTYRNYDFNEKKNVKDNPTIYNTFDGEARYDLLFNAANRLITGVNVLNESVSGNAIEDGQKQSYEIAGFIQETYNVKNQSKLVITTGLRGTYNSRFSGAVTPKIGVRFNAADPLWLRIAFGTGFKTPTFKQNYYDSFIHPKPHDFVLNGNIDLSPEKSRSVNGSVGGELRLLSYELYAHLATLEDKITTDVISDEGGALDDGRVYSYRRGYVNVAEGRSYGADLTLSLTGIKQLTLDGSFSYLYMEDRGSSESEYQESELYSPYSFKVATTLDLRSYNSSIPVWNTMFNYESEQLWDRTARDDNDKYLESYHTLNTSLKEYFGETFSLAVGVNNLFDAHSETLGFGYGRIGYVDLRVHF